MKKTPTQEQLISLARLAPKVEWQQDKEPETEYKTSVLDFFHFLGLKGGRFPVKVKDLFYIFESWDSEGLTYGEFRTSLKSYVKFDKKAVNCKLNNTLKNIQEKYKNTLESLKDNNEEE